MANLDNFVTELCSLLTELNFNNTVAFFDKNFAASEKYVFSNNPKNSRKNAVIPLTIVFYPHL